MTILSQHCDQQKCLAVPSGVRFSGRTFSAAELEFKKAVTFFNEDARYYYFLGMSLYLQGKKKAGEAEFYVGEGVKLEIARKTTSQVINASLERVQG